MAYDDFASGKRAMDACHLMVSQLRGGAELRSSMWKFDVLRSDKLNQIAVEDAIDADVIIVANARNTGLPDAVKTWINGWVPRKRGQSAALVALLDFSEDEAQLAGRARALLKEAAAAARIDFLPQETRLHAGPPPNFPDPPEAEPPRAAPSSHAQRTPMLEGWGIND
jgi:hypothetical protein